MNELLDRCQPGLLPENLFPDLSSLPRTAPAIRPNPETECRRSCRHGVCGENQTPGRGEERANTNLVSRLLTGICFWTGLTPELRRTALRPCVSEDHSGLHEAAKRSRLERIVSALKPAVVAGRHGSLVWRGAKKCCTGRRHIGFEICRRQGESLSGKLLMALPTTALCKDLVLLRANA